MLQGRSCPVAAQRLSCSVCLGFGFPPVSSQFRIEFVLRKVVGEVAQGGEADAEHDFECVGIGETGGAEGVQLCIRYPAARRDYCTGEDCNCVETGGGNRLLLAD